MKLLISGVVVGYALVLVSSGAWRLMVRSLAYHPWSEIAHGMAEAFPWSRWRGLPRLIGAPLEWCFAGLILAVFVLFLGLMEILFSSRDIYLVSASSSLGISKEPTTRWRLLTRSGTAIDIGLDL
jgi:hypothetical protein